MIRGWPDPHCGADAASTGQASSPEDATMPDRDTSCPLCGGSNDCAMANHQVVTACWCIHTPILPAVLARVPAAKVNSACVCKACATTPE